MALTRLRENYNLPTEGWSRWVIAMVRDRPASGQRYYEERGEGNVGFICRNVNDAFDDYGCGIYELQARGPGGNKEVYVGCTCRRYSSRNRHESLRCPSSSEHNLHRVIGLFVNTDTFCILIPHCNLKVGADFLNPFYFR